MSTNTSDIIVSTLQDWGVDKIFGLPGDGINGFTEALREHSAEIEFVQARHEEAAAFMACGYAKYTGGMGVCMATSGPGAIHLLNGLYDATMDGQSVLAITGNQFHDLMQTHGQQDVDVKALYEDVSHYNVQVNSPEHAENVANIACRAAMYGNGVAHMTIPKDLQNKDLESGERSTRNIARHTGEEAYSRFTSAPKQQDLRRAADLLNDGGDVAILAGRGCFGAREELIEASDRLAAPIAKALLGKSVVPDDDPHTTGSLGLLGTRPSQESMNNCDTLFMIGSSFPYIEFLPDPDSTQCVQIDHNPQRIGLRHPVDAPLVGDVKETLRELVPMLDERDDRTFLVDANEKMQDWWQDMEQRGTSRETPMKPQVVAWELGKRLDDDAIVACDSGTIATWWARQIPARKNQMHTVSGNLATMACGFPYAMAGQMAYPDRQCVAFVGDGGFSMLMAEMATCTKYDLPLTVVVVKNNELGQIKWEQMVMEGNPEYGIDLEPVDFSAAAKGFGWNALTIENPELCGEKMERALASPSPTLVEAVVDPYTP
ncbi:MAG: thiamine pyrophosphate-dependent enzyme, partial [Bradymonadaceae bacterium]